jgi:hypothetical protein
MIHNIYRGYLAAHRLVKLACQLCREALEGVYPVVRFQEIGTIQ